MSTHKTNLNKRNEIRYEVYDEKGNKKPYITIRPGENGVTELDIHNYYTVEDSEVYHNNRALNPNAWLTKEEKRALRAEKEEWANNFIAKFKAEHGYEPTDDDVEDAVAEAFPKNWTGSIEEMTGATSDDDGYQDKSSVWVQVASPSEEEVSEDVERLREIVESFSERWKTVYRRVIIFEESKVEVGADLGISGVRVGQIEREIKKKISEDEILKNFFKRPSI